MTPRETPAGTKDSQIVHSDSFATGSSGPPIWVLWFLSPGDLAGVAGRFLRPVAETTTLQ